MKWELFALIQHVQLLEFKRFAEMRFWVHRCRIPGLWSVMHGGGNGFFKIGRRVLEPPALLLCMLAWMPNS